jgi:spermidine/putrescine transport system ATP-binding protein
MCMKSIHIKNVSKSLGGEAILENLNLIIPSGKFFVLLGPSGCGKTTLLRLIGGFETVDEGTILLGDKDITFMPINERKIDTVFQNYALFPHLSVFDNVAYSQRLKKLPQDIIAEKVMKMLETVGLERHALKGIDQLSGGQQQRVALARAIINEPAVLLLDEPLAALDVKLREKMLIELIELQESLKTTFLYVTHDQFEALTVADQMAIMNSDGQVEQIGTPKEIYEFPKSAFVAQFVGTTNVMKGKLTERDGAAAIEVKELGSFLVDVPQDKQYLMVQHADVLLSIRPEKIEISKTPVAGFSNMLQGSVKSIVYYGRSTQYNVVVNRSLTLQVFEQNEEHFPQEVIDYDDTVYLYWQKENVVILER